MSGPHPGRLSAVVLAAALALTACGGDDKGDGKTHLTFWDNNASPTVTPIWQKTITDFEAANPDIKVDYVGIPTAQVSQKYDTAIASNALPDVGAVTTAFLGNLTAQKALAPLDERLAGSPLNGKLSAPFLTLVKGATADGKLYELPLSGNVGTLWYRTDWFKDKNLKLDTWDDFYSAAGKLTDAKNNRFGFTIRGGAGSIAQMLEMVYGQSGVAEFFDASGKTTVNDPRNVAALERLVSLYKKATPAADVNNDYTKMVAQFDGGTIGVMQHNLGSSGDHKKALGGPDKVLGTTVPAAPGGGHVIVSNPVTGVGVFKSGKHQDAAWKFAEFASGADNSSHFNSSTGQIPANTDSAAAPWVSENPTLANAVKVMADPSTKVVQLPYYLPEFSAVTKTEAEPLFQKVLLGSLPAKDFLDQIATKLNDAQAKYKQRNGG
ncbi:sugar ABC transporter substrate-binding protein [Actinocorallia longicatena]|uniref:Sugar ABC transporter substrate-binding protein n=1 Tax=Actinocorallia longicatena TaxID=111803 RepID=A0ABP6QC07_9ACTN